MMALVAAAASGRPAVGFGPHAFGQPLLHHTTAAVTHNADATAVAGNARRRHIATAMATAKSTGK
jgi:hypothetical protein